MLIGGEQIEHTAPPEHLPTQEDVQAEVVGTNELSEQQTPGESVQAVSYTTENGVTHSAKNVQEAIGKGCIYLAGQPGKTSERLFKLYAKGAAVLAEAAPKQPAKRVDTKASTDRKVEEPRAIEQEAISPTPVQPEVPNQLVHPEFTEVSPVVPASLTSKQSSASLELTEAIRLSHVQLATAERDHAPSLTSKPELVLPRPEINRPAQQENISLEVKITEPTQASNTRTAREAEPEQVDSLPTSSFLEESPISVIDKDLQQPGLLPAEAMYSVGEIVPVVEIDDGLLMIEQPLEAGTEWIVNLEGQLEVSLMTALESDPQPELVERKEMPVFVKLLPEDVQELVATRLEVDEPELHVQFEAFEIFMAEAVEQLRELSEDNNSEQALIETVEQAVEQKFIALLKLLQIEPDEAIVKHFMARFNEVLASVSETVETEVALDEGTHEQKHDFGSLAHGLSQTLSQSFRSMNLARFMVQVSTV